MNHNGIKLAMFDMDGTLFDTEKANYLAYKEACGDDYPLSETFFHEKCMSRNYKEFLPLLGVPEDMLGPIHKKKLACYTKHFGSIQPNRHLFAIAEGLKRSGTKLCLVTTASEKNTLELLDFFQYTDIFDLLVTQETVHALKPAPDAYLYAIEYFQVDPADTVIFEDSDLGIEAAEKTGASVFRVEKFPEPV